MFYEYLLSTFLLKQHCLNFLGMILSMRRIQNIYYFLVNYEFRETQITRQKETPLACKLLTSIF